MYYVRSISILSSFGVATTCRTLVKSLSVGLIVALFDVYSSTKCQLIAELSTRMKNVQSIHTSL